MSGRRNSTKRLYLGRQRNQANSRRSRAKGCQGGVKLYEDSGFNPDWDESDAALWSTPELGEGVDCAEETADTGECAIPLIRSWGLPRAKIAIGATRAGPYSSR